MKDALCNVATETNTTGNSSPTVPYDSENSKQLTLVTDATTEKVIVEISYSDQSIEAQTEPPIKDILASVSSMQPVETSSIASELPEFSHTPDTTLTNSSSSSGSSPPQPNTSNTSNNTSFQCPTDLMSQGLLGLFCSIETRDRIKRITLTAVLFN